jgi:hypothetical protein
VKGTPNRQTKTLLERAEAIGVDPFEILLLFAKADWKALGYDSKSTTKWTSSGIEYEEDVITPELRVTAAKEACQYMHPKRKATELTLVDESKLNAIAEVEKLPTEELVKDAKRFVEEFEKKAGKA